MRSSNAMTGGIVDNSDDFAKCSLNSLTSVKLQVPSPYAYRPKEQRDGTWPRSEPITVSDAVHQHPAVQLFEFGFPQGLRLFARLPGCRMGNKTLAGIVRPVLRVRAHLADDFLDDMLSAPDLLPRDHFSL
jgi:hypothetical protein